ncbi:hypothetical protein [Longivirga aurantiaca]|uniref:Uncharacterized protein n=1 Tax=Longivirga aurantiaca TaxID=1837743 RepID=A0ABW1SY17_9ACTN
MKRALIGLAVAAVAVLSLAPPAASAAPPPVSRPLTGTVVTQDLPPEAPTGCPAGAVWRYTASGTAYLSNLGRSQFTISHCSYLTGPTTGTFDHGTIVIIAANGDQLYMAESGTFYLYVDESGGLISVPTVDWTITGGTGRFLHATGSGQLLARSSDLQSPPTTTSGTFSQGEITYVASDRRS